MKSWWLFAFVVLLLMSSGCQKGIDWFFYDDQYDSYEAYLEAEQLAKYDDLHGEPSDLQEPLDKPFESIMDDIESVLVVEDYAQSVDLPCDVDSDCSDVCDEGFKITRRCVLGEEGRDSKRSLMEARDEVRERIAQTVFGYRWVISHSSSLSPEQKDEFIRVVEEAKAEIEALKLQEKELDDLIESQQFGVCRPTPGPHDECANPESCVVIEGTAQCKIPCQNETDCPSVCDDPYVLNQMRCVGAQDSEGYCEENLVECGPQESCVQEEDGAICKESCKEYAVPPESQMRVLEKEGNIGFRYRSHTVLEFSGSSDCAQGSATKTGHSTKIYADSGDLIYDVKRTDSQTCSKPGGLDVFNARVGVIDKDITIEDVKSGNTDSESKKIYFTNHCSGTGKLQAAYCDASVILRSIDEKKIAADGVPAYLPSRDWATVGVFTNQIFGYESVDCSKFQREDGSPMECIEDPSLIEEGFDEGGMALHPIDRNGNTLIPAYCG